MINLGNILEDTTVDFMWDTNDGVGASVTRTTDGTVSVYKANGVVQSVAGITDIEDFDGLTGIHHCRIDLSADAFYAIGNDYMVVLSGATIDGQVVNHVLAYFSIENRGVNVVQISGDATAADNLESTYDGTGYSDANAPATQNQIGNLSTGSAAISVASESYALTSGIESANAYTDTTTVDGVRHEHTDAAGVLDLYYQFNVTGAGVGATATVRGRVNGSNDDLGVYAYNWITTAWDKIGEFEGTNSSNDTEETYNLLVAHTGIGANLGKIRIRFFAVSGLTSATLRVDQIIASYAVVSQTVGYAQGAIWVDTNASNTNTEAYVDGVADNPVSTWAAALTLSSTLGISRFRIANSSAITLTGDSSNYNIGGQAYTLALNGQNITNATIFGATVSGVGTGGGTVFEDCPIGDVTLSPSIMRRCFLSGTITNAGTGDWFINHSVSRVAGTSSPIFDFGTAIGNTNLNMRLWSGGIQLESMGNTGTDTASIEGFGQIIEGTCAGGVVAVRGHFPVSGLTNITLMDDARYTESELVKAFWDRKLTGATHNIKDSAGLRFRQLQEFGSYEGGAIFIDTVGGSAGTTNYESGTNLNPVDNLADALTLAVSLNLKTFHVVTGSSITFAQTINNYWFKGHGWVLALGGQDVSGTHISGPASISGIGIGSDEIEFHNCSIGNVTLNKAHFETCGFSGTVTMTEAVNYEVENCRSTDNNIAIFDFGVAVANIDLNLTGWDGKVELKNMGQAGIDVANIGGCGGVIINANCIGGTVDMCGNLTFTNNGSGQTINDDARVDRIDNEQFILIHKWITNRLVTLGDTIVLYDDDGVTPLKTWTWNGALQERSKAT